MVGRRGSSGGGGAWPRSQPATSRASMVRARIVRAAAPGRARRMPVLLLRGVGSGYPPVHGTDGPAAILPGAASRRPAGPSGSPRAGASAVVPRVRRRRCRGALNRSGRIWLAAAGGILLLWAGLISNQGTAVRVLELDHAVVELVRRDAHRAAHRRHADGARPRLALAGPGAVLGDAQASPAGRPAGVPSPRRLPRGPAARWGTHRAARPRRWPWRGRLAGRTWRWRGTGTASRTPRCRWPLLALVTVGVVRHTSCFRRVRCVGPATRGFGPPGRGRRPLSRPLPRHRPPDFQTCWSPSVMGWRCAGRLPLDHAGGCVPRDYRGGNGAHVEMGGRRGQAVRRALADQLGVRRPTSSRSGSRARPAPRRCGSPSSASPRLAVRQALHGQPPALGPLVQARPDRAVRPAGGREAVHDGPPARAVRGLHAAAPARRGPRPEPDGLVEITPEREYLIVTEFFEGAQEIGEVEVFDEDIDDGLRMVRRLWDAGLAHRDIKPANLMVRDGQVLLIDVAFARFARRRGARRSTWRT